jgi:hypothetical protein
MLRHDSPIQPSVNNTLHSHLFSLVARAAKGIRFDGLPSRPIDGWAMRVGRSGAYVFPRCVAPVRRRTSSANLNLSVTKFIDAYGCWCSDAVSGAPHASYAHCVTFLGPRSAAHTFSRNLDPPVIRIHGEPSATTTTTGTAAHKGRGAGYICQPRRLMATHSETGSMR